MSAEDNLSEEYKNFLVSKSNELYNSIGHFQTAFYDVIDPKNAPNIDDKKKDLVSKTENFLESHTRMMAEIYFLRYVLEEQKIKLEEKINEIKQPNLNANAETSSQSSRQNK